MQMTLERPVEIVGNGLFTGKPCKMRIFPSDSGIVFSRVDLPGKPEIPASLEFVSETPRCTCLAKDGASVQMVEHLLSALRGLKIDHARVEISGPEIPACDGSARPFVEAFENAGIQSLTSAKQILRIEKPIAWSRGDVHLVALPATGLRISYTLHYPQSSLIGSQFASYELVPATYRSEISACRTFSLYEEIAPLLEKGLIQGGLENGVVIQENRVLNQGGLRFPDEMVRHKILDLIGDLALLGVPLEGHIIAIRSGHAHNIAFAKEIAINSTFK